MNASRIAELLAPFLSPISNPRHSDPPFQALVIPNRAKGPVRNLLSASLSESQLQSISTYIDLLLRWNARINLTAVRDPEEIVTRHFGESLFAARQLFPRAYPVSSVPPVVKDFDVDLADLESRSRPDNPPGRAALQGRVPEKKENRALALEPLANDRRRTTEDRDRLADLGSGAGFPGIPIKLWAPQISLTLIESSHKKATFLREVARALTLTDVNIQNVRAETLPPATFNVVTLRAVERFAQSLPAATRLLAPGARLALLIASSQLETAKSTLPDIHWTDPTPIPQSHSRLLLTGFSL
jgi:16S rRNA (guanine(527)-N(7))-methyltransferase RsmG